LPEQVAEENEKYGDSEISPALLRTQIRYLLARRLMRSQRSDEAREYFPPEWTPHYLALVQSLRTGWDETLPADQRAQALFQAAIITRTNGMELIGTEVEPDWHVHRGNFQEGVSVSSRATNENAKALVAGEDEQSRATHHNADPEKRFHYRYQAAALAWEAAKLATNNFEEAAHMLCTAAGWLRIRDPEAADTFYNQAASLAWEAVKLMPDNSEETARVLCIAGGWLKNRDPKKADIFYKALVRRNRKTAIGMEADRIRWFPQLDEQGKLIPREPSRLESMEPPRLPDRSSEQPSVTEADKVARAYPIPGKSYMIHSGDTLAHIAQAAGVLGQPVTVQEILTANPGLDASRLRVGQKIIIPGLNPDSPESVPGTPADPASLESPNSEIPAPASPP
jgi:LysM repeat protein